VFLTKLFSSVEIEVQKNKYIITGDRAGFLKGMRDAGNQ